MIDYYSAEKWEEFVVTKITPIRDYAVALLNFWKFLKDLDGKDTSYVLKKYPKFDVVFLGGVDEKEYKENSFAKAIKEIFGAEIADLNSYQAFVLQGLEPAVPIMVHKTQIVGWIELIKDVAELIIKKADINSNQKEVVVSKDEYIEQPDKVFKGLQNLLQHCLNVCVGYDKYMTFIWNIRKITRKYLELAFPETKNGEKFQFLRDFLGLTEIFALEVEDEKLRRDYTIYGFPDVYSDFDVSDRYADTINPDEYREVDKLMVVLKEKVNTLGGLLLWLNRLIWLLFDYSHCYYYSYPLRDVVENLPNPRREYLDVCRKELEKLNWSWKNNKYLYNIKIYDVSYSRKHAYYNLRIYLIDKDLIKDEKGVAVSRLFGFLDQISPALFLGTYELVLKDDATFMLVKRE